jgi:hypothetical protein
VLKGIAELFSRENQENAPFPVEWYANSALVEKFGNESFTIRRVFGFA